MLPLLVAGAFTVTTLVVLALLGVLASRRQAEVAPEWWIPLFLKAGGCAALLGATGMVATEYSAWAMQDAEVEQIVRQNSVKSEQRESGRTVYEFNVGPGGGWGKIIRYDFEIVWEALAAVAVVAGALGGILSLVIARVTIRIRKAPAAFPLDVATHVLVSRPLDGDEAR